MDLVPLLSTIILVATIATLILGVFSYFLFRLRERRVARAGMVRRDKIFFKRYRPRSKES